MQQLQYLYIFHGFSFLLYIINKQMNHKRLHNTEFCCTVIIQVANNIKLCFKI